MSITVIPQDVKSRTDGDINEERSYRGFLILSDTPIGPITAANASGVPDYFDEDPDDSSYLMKHKIANPLGEEGGRYKWFALCDYSNRIIRPLDMPAQIEWDFSEASESYFLDETEAGDDCPCGTTATADGCPVVNSAGQPFDSIPTREVGAISLTITKNVATDFDVGTFLTYADTINDGGFTVDGVSIDTKQAKVSGANVSPPQLSNGEWYRVVKLVIKLKQKTWDDIFADFGYYETDGAGGLEVITSGTPPQQLQKPWPLDGSGSAQGDLSDPPAKLVYFPYETSDFGSLSALLS